MKISIVVLVYLLFLNMTVIAAPIESYSTQSSFAMEEEIYRDLPIEDLNDFIVRMNQELDVKLPVLSLELLKKIIENGITEDEVGLSKGLLTIVFHELVQNLNLMGKLIFLSVLCVLLRNLQYSFEQSNISLLAYGICFALLSVIALQAFYHVTQIVTVTVDYMVSFMEALLPLLFTLLTASGGVLSAALLTPLMLFMVNFIGFVVQHVIVPFLMIGAILECVNYFSAHYKLTKLVQLFKQISMIILGFMMMVFIGIVTIKGMSGGIADGLALRTAKFATATFVPVVGKVFSDTVEIVMGASLLMKNAIGMFGVLVIALICTIPVMKVFILATITKLTGALLEPMGDEKMAECLTTMGNSLLLLAGALLSVALMFFLAVAMVIGIGGMTLMLH